MLKTITEKYDIDENNRDHIVAWLDDRKDFHKWFTTLITGSFVALTIFGKTPALTGLAGQLLVAALALLLFSILCNLVCVWSIPSWKLGVQTKRTNNNFRMRIELDIPAWIGVICFVSGLTFGFLGNAQ